MKAEESNNNSNDRSTTPEAVGSAPRGINPIGDPAVMIPFLEHVMPAMEMHQGIYSQLQAELEAYKNKK